MQYSMKMKDCNKCDTKILETSMICPNCGVYQADEGHFGYWLLGVIFPFSSILLYFSLKDIKPKTAVRALKGVKFSIYFIIATVSAYILESLLESIFSHIFI